MRPVAAVVAGFCADRWKSSTAVIGAFALAALASSIMVLLAPADSLVSLLWTTILIGCLGIFALRGIYFALLEESRVPVYLTGTAVGVVSFIGYTPEIFMPVLGGYLIDLWDGGSTGYQVLFGVLVAASAVGIAATLGLRFIGRAKAEARSPNAGGRSREA